MIPAPSANKDYAEGCAARRALSNGREAIGCRLSAFSFNSSRIVYPPIDRATLSSSQKLKAKS
jgi:hypothetical protein